MGRLCVLANTGQKTLKRINQLLQDISRNDYDGIGKSEPVTYSHHLRGGGVCHY